MGRSMGHTHKQTEKVVANGSPSAFDRLKSQVKGKALPRLTGNEAKVLLAFYVYANWKNGTAFPSLAGLGEDLEVADSTVAAAMKGLEKKGFLKTLRRGGGRRRSSLRELLPCANTNPNISVCQRNTNETKGGNTNETKQETLMKSGETLKPALGELYNRTIKENKPYRTRSESRSFRPRKDVKEKGEADDRGEKIVRRLVKYGASEEAARRFLRDEGFFTAMKLRELCRVKASEEENVTRFLRWAVKHPAKVKYPAYMSMTLEELEDRTELDEPECQWLEYLRSKKQRQVERVLRDGPKSEADFNVMTEHRAALARQQRAERDSIEFAREEKERRLVQDRRDQKYRSN
jgi:DNA-binding MarR family transcriptional regulator